MEIAEIHCIVRGRVQGVMYRDFVTRRARSLAVTGCVENLPDSTVEIVAQGHTDDLEKFLKHVNKGSLLAKVSRVDVEWREPGELYERFDIVF